MELISSLSCLKHIVRFIWINYPIRPAVLPAESAELASIILGRFVAKASDVVSSPGVDGDATKIINGVGMPEDNISVSIGVLLCAVHRMAVAVDKGERAALVNSTHGIIGEHPRLRLLHNQFDIFNPIIGIVPCYPASRVAAQVIYAFIVVAPQKDSLIPELKELSQELLPAIPIFLQARCLLLIPCTLSDCSEVPEITDADNKPAILADVFLGKSKQSFYRWGVLFIAVDISTSNELYWLHVGGLLRPVRVV